MKTFPVPQYIQLYPTYRCNQNCPFCFNVGASAADMQPDRAMDLLDILLHIGIHDLDIMGGEPFLLPWIPSYLNKAASHGITVNISTNGSFPEIMKMFSGTTPDKINIGVSLEGSSAEKHNRNTNSSNFEKAVLSIKNLVSIGLDPLVKTVLSRHTTDDINDIIRLLQDLGVKRYYLIHMDLFSEKQTDIEGTLSFREFTALYQQTVKENQAIEINRVNASCFEKKRLPEGVRCAGGVRKLSIMPDGAVYPCNLFQHFPDFRLGNIFEDDFEAIWLNRKLDLFRNFDMNRCAMTDCLNHISCTGGCPAHALFHGQDLHGADFRCQRRPAP